MTPGVHALKGLLKIIVFLGGTLIKCSFLDFQSTVERLGGIWNYRVRTTRNGSKLYSRLQWIQFPQFHSATCYYYTAKILEIVVQYLSHLLPNQKFHMSKNF